MLSLLLLLQIDLPPSVCGRRYHSISSITITNNIQWIVTVGGMGARNNPVTMIVEMGKYSDTITNEKVFMLLGVWFMLFGAWFVARGAVEF